MNKKPVVLLLASLTAAISCVGIKVVGAPPNFESLMPFVASAGIALGPVYGFMTGLFARASFDGYQAWAGWWTLLTAVSYGLVGLLAGFAGKAKQKWGRIELTLLAGALTLVYDAVTMLLFTIPFGIPLPVALAGQLPFTLMHLLSCMLLSFLFAPFLLKTWNELDTPVQAYARITQPNQQKQSKEQ